MVILGYRIQNLHESVSMTVSGLCEQFKTASIEHALKVKLDWILTCQRPWLDNDVWMASLLI